MHPAADTVNRIRRLESQLPWLSKARAALLGLAKIFIQHLLHDQFSIILIHRHLDLHPDHLMVSEWLDDETLQTAIEPIGAREVYPSAFFLGAGGDFIPFEYSTTETYPPPEPFLRDVKTFLLEHRIEEVLGFATSTSNMCEWIETMLPDDRGTIAKPITDSLMHEIPDSVITEWSIKRLPAGQEDGSHMLQCMDGEGIDGSPIGIQLGPRVRCVRVTNGHRQDTIW